MKSIWHFLIALTFAITANSAFTQVAAHGRLRTSGNKIVDKNGAVMSLAGNSLFWSIPGWGGDKYWNANVVSFLKNDWKAKVIRAAMGVEDGGGYIQNPTANKDLVKKVVDACIANDVYVIIDWHSHYANQYQSQAVAFFTEMATLYGAKDHVIYEIWNEPVGAVSWPNVVKPYCNAVIAAIRSKDPDNLIVVGSPDWSTDVHIATADPINDSNVAYAFHFYAATHFAAHRADAQVALDRNKALFITEWGTCASNGGGSVNQTSTNEWMDWARQNKLSHCNWAINDKAETASALKPGASTSGGWTDASLTTSGLLVRGLVRGWATGGSSGIPSPARIINSYTTKSLRPYNAGTGDNVNIVQFAYNNTWTSERWQIANLGNGYHSIINVYTGKSLRPLNGSTSSGAKIVQFSYDSTWQSEQWQLIPNGAGYYGIKNRYSGLALRPLNAGTGDDVQIVQEPYDASWGSMKWQIAAP